MNERIEILDGVKLGDPVITIGNTTLKEGSPVLLEDPKEEKPSKQEGE